MATAQLPRSKFIGGSIIAKNQNTFAKRNREMEKKRKADEKRQDREKKKNEEPLAPGESGIQIAYHPDSDCPPERLSFGG